MTLEERWEIESEILKGVFIKKKSNKEGEIKMEYICRIPTIEEVNERWKYLVDSHEEDRMNWEQWRNEALYNFGKRSFIIYYGFLDGKVICEATAIVNTTTD